MDGLDIVFSAMFVQSQFTSLLFCFLDTDLISAEGKKQIFNSFLFAAVVVNTSTHTDDSVVCRAAHSKRWNDDTLTEILKFSSLFGTLLLRFSKAVSLPIDIINT